MDHAAKSPNCLNFKDFFSAILLAVAPIIGG